MFNVHTRGVQTPNVVIGMALFAGGLTQFLAGMWEVPNGNTFGAVGKDPLNFDDDDYLDQVDEILLSILVLRSVLDVLCNDFYSWIWDRRIFWWELGRI